MKTTEQKLHLNGQPVTLVSKVERGQVWIETADGSLLRVYRAGLTVTASRAVGRLTAAAPVSGRAFNR